MYIVRLMSRCDCMCAFCLVRDEIRAADDLDYRIACTEIERLAPEEPIDFFGGEPTLYPYFFDLATFAASRGHRLTLASHCMKAADRSFAERLSAIGFSEIRTSIYSPTPFGHDQITRHPRSFEKTTAGIHNLVELGQDVNVTLVITRACEGTLPAMVLAAYTAGARKVKFSLLVKSDENPSYTPDLGRFKKSLDEAIVLCRQLGMRFSLSKMPFCLAPDHVAAFVCEGNYDYVPGPPDHPACRECVLRTWCHGLEPAYLASNVTGLLAPIQFGPQLEAIRVTDTNVDHLQVKAGPWLTLFSIDRSDRNTLTRFLLRSAELQNDAKRFEGDVGVIFEPGRLLT